MMRQRTIWTSVLAAACGLGLALPAATADSHAKKGPKLHIGGREGPGGTIKGTVKFDGRQPTPKKVRVDADPACAHAHKDNPLRNEKYIWGKNGTLQNVFVYVSKGVKGKKFDVPAKAAVIDQKGCAYAPHVSGVMVKQTLEIRNSDKTTHNVKINSKKNGKDNRGMAPNVKPIQKTFKKAEMPVNFKCDVHPWMGAYLHVMSHPFFAVTQADGTYEIRGLPPGDYEVSVWHEFKKFKPDKKAAPVTVKEGETADVDFTYKASKKKKK